MIPEFGQFALILALSLACIQSLLPLSGSLLKRPVLLRFARPAAIGQAVFVFFAFLCLIFAFVSNDFSVTYVAQNSNTRLPLFYRITALWSAHEGSMLLWVSVLAVWTLLVAVCSRSLPRITRAQVLAILGLISIGFLIFILSTSDPFARLLPDYPSDGQSLNPLLQDPGLAMHPPMLYMGYVGFSVAFAFAITALLQGRLDAAWVKWVRPWTLAAWSFLTLGITLGSWWSYRVLGWGGWWFWDPVENASFLPWLTGTALLHALLVTEKRGVFKSWTLLLALLTFALSLLGTFLVRSGVLISVHAFAADPARGAYMLKFLFLVVGLSLLLFAWRAHKIKGAAPFALLSRESLLLSNNVLLIVAMATILLGTLYPLVLDALDLGKISVGPPYFNTVFIPLMTPLLFIMGLGPQAAWQHMPAQALLRRFSFVLMVSLILGISLPLLFSGKKYPLLWLGMGLSCWILLTTLQLFLRHCRQTGVRKIRASQFGMMLAHMGLALTVLGITLTSFYSLERDVRMQPGDTAQLGRYQFRFSGVQSIAGPNYQALRAKFSLSEDGRYLATLWPEQRIFPIADEAISEPAIQAGFFQDVYIALGDSIHAQSFAVRMYYKPFVRWIWFGGLLMLLGGVVSLCDRRYRRGSKA